MLPTCTPFPISPLQSRSDPPAPVHSIASAPNAPPYPHPSPLHPPGHPPLVLFIPGRLTPLSQTSPTASLSPSPQHSDPSAALLRSPQPLHSPGPLPLTPGALSAARSRRPSRPEAEQPAFVPPPRSPRANGSARHCRRGRVGANRKAR